MLTYRANAVLYSVLEDEKHCGYRLPVPFKNPVRRIFDCSTAYRSFICLSEDRDLQLLPAITEKSIEQ